MGRFRKERDMVRHSGENRRSPQGRCELTTHIKQMDEDQKSVDKKDVSFKVFLTEAEAKEYKKDIEKQTGKRYSDVGHIGDKHYVAYSRIGEITALALEESAEHFNMRSPITGGYMLGRTWAECH